MKTNLNKIKLIAFDLDDTLLTHKKVLTQENFNALKNAADLGIQIVPATGRFWSAVPDSVKNLDFVNYAIAVNGAEIRDVKNNIAISKSEIPLQRALNIMRLLDDLPVIYDCIIDGKSYIARKYYDLVESFALDEIQLSMLRNLRTPVDNFYEFDISKSSDVQKLQMFTLDYELRAKLLESFKIVFPENAISSSVANNIEFNDKNAEKGLALKKLSEILKINLENTMSFGDGLNDISMIRNAGIGIAMNNACSELKAIADYVTLSCDESGVAEGIKKFCL